MSEDGWGTVSVTGRSVRYTADTKELNEGAELIFGHALRCSIWSGEANANRRLSLETFMATEHDQIPSGNKLWNFWTEAQPFGDKLLSDVIREIIFTLCSEFYIY
jgi:hypothetical protein